MDRQTQNTERIAEQLTGSQLIELGARGCLGSYSLGGEYSNAFRPFTAGFQQ